MKDPVTEKTQYNRMRQKVRRRSTRKYKKEPSWSKSSKAKSPKGMQKRWMLMMLVGLIALLATFFNLTTSHTNSGANNETEHPDPILRTTAADSKPMVPPDTIAKAFIAAKGAEEKLKWVRQPEVVKERLMQAPEELLQTENVKLSLYSISSNLDCGYVSYIAYFPNGKKRLLSVVPTEQGQKVDWDTYIRHGTATWEQLLTEQVNTADMRVIVKPFNYYNFQYHDEKKWRCFIINSPDLPRSIYAYTKRNTKTDQTLLHLSTTKRAILRLTSQPDSARRRQFTITHVVSSDWLMPTETFQDRYMTPLKKP